MKRHTRTASTKKAVSPALPDYLRPSVKPVLGDSAEVVEQYYRDRIQSFSLMLEQLNVLEDAPEIEFLCREIIACRTILLKLAASEKNAA